MSKPLDNDQRVEIHLIDASGGYVYGVPSEGGNRPTTRSRACCEAMTAVRLAGDSRRMAIIWYGSRLGPHTFSPFVILAVRLGGPNDRRTSKPFALDRALGPTEYYLPSGTVTGPHKAARETDARDDPDRRWVPQRQPIAVL